jgi:hypothetical protein
MYEDKELYGKIEYFFVHSYLEKQQMLAYIQWTSDIHINRYSIKTFQGFKSNDFIKVEYIDRCVGFMKIDNDFYIFDKENQVVYEK